MTASIRSTRLRVALTLLLVLGMYIAISMTVAVRADPQGSPNTTLPYTDVTPNQWAYSSVKELWLLDLLPGYPDGTFGGSRGITRYEAADSIYRTMSHFGLTLPANTGITIPDIVNDGKPQASDIQQLVDAKVFTVYPDGTFGGQRIMSRYEYACVLCSLANRFPNISALASKESTPPIPPDVPAGHWALKSILELISLNGMNIEGIEPHGLFPDGTFCGRQSVTRYEFAVSLANIITLAQQRNTN